MMRGGAAHSSENESLRAKARQFLEQLKAKNPNSEFSVPANTKKVGVSEMYRNWI